MYVDSLFDKNNLQHICCKVRNPEAFISDAIILIVYANDDTDKLLLPLTDRFKSLYIIK
jgi:hypothetical protein